MTSTARKRKARTAVGFDLTPEHRRQVVASGGEVREVFTDVAGVRARVVEPPIEGYGRRGSLTARQVEAARRWYDDYEVGICGACERPEVAVPVCGVAGGYTMSERRIDALTRHRRALEAIHTEDRQTAVLVVLHQISCDRLADGRYRARCRLMDSLRRALDAVADTYKI